MTDVAWLAHARSLLGARERAGDADNQTIMQLFRDVGHGWVEHDETAWCAAFVGACLERSGIRSTRSLRARSYLDWGVELAEPRLGCIAVLSRGRDPALGHVAFYLGHDGDGIRLLGGNQDNAVTIARYPASRVLSYRWPLDQTVQPATDPTPTDTFDIALRHVLALEGGWSNHRKDPGGPTNMGVTLATYAAHRGVRLTTLNRAGLSRALRQIDDDTVRAIYRARYWLKASCDTLAPAIALMHFDCAVNQGVARARRFLQTTLDVEADGKIGPETLAAAAAADPARVIERYAELRRQHYRSLAGFRHFGRGWLRRVERTLAAARALIKSTASHDSNQETTMPDSAAKATEPSMPPDRKWWGHSVTIWGALVSAAAVVLPALGPVLGIDVTPAMIRQLGGELGALMQLVAGLAGTALTIYGRVRATRGLIQRTISLRV